MIFWNVIPDAKPAVVRSAIVESPELVRRNTLQVGVALPKLLAAIDPTFVQVEWLFADPETETERKWNVRKSYEALKKRQNWPKDMDLDASLLFVGDRTTVSRLCEGIIACYPEKFGSDSAIRMVDFLSSPASPELRIRQPPRRTPPCGHLVDPQHSEPSARDACAIVTSPACVRPPPDIFKRLIARAAVRHKGKRRMLIELSDLLTADLESLETIEREKVFPSFERIIKLRQIDKEFDLLEVGKKERESIHLKIEQLGEENAWNCLEEEGRF
jgi:hypothetical protein